MSLLVSFFLAVLFGVLSAAATAFVCSLVVDTTIHQLHNFIIIIQQFRNPTDQKVWNNTFASLGCSSVLVSFFLALLFGVLSAAAAFVFFSSSSCRDTQFFQFIISRRPSQITSHASARARVRGHGRKHPPTRGYRRAFRRG